MVRDFFKPLNCFTICVVVPICGLLHGMLCSLLKAGQSLIVADIHVCYFWWIVVSMTILPHHFICTLNLQIQLYIKE